MSLGLFNHGIDIRGAGSNEYYLTVGYEKKRK